MNLLSLFVQVYLLLIAINIVHSQVTLTANLKDIKAIIKEIAPEELVDKLTKNIFDVILNNTQDGRRNINTKTTKEISTRQFIIINEKRVDFETLVDMVKKRLVNRRKQVPRLKTANTETILRIGKSRRKDGLVTKFKVTLSNIKDISFESTTTKGTKEKVNNNFLRQRSIQTTKCPKKSHKHKHKLQNSHRGNVSSKSKEDIESWLMNKNKRFKIVARKDYNKPLNYSNLNVLKKGSIDDSADKEEIKITKTVSKIRDLLKIMSEENKGWEKRRETTKYSSEDVYSDEFSIKTIASSEIKAETKRLGLDELSAEISFKTTEMLRKDWYKAPTPDYIKKTTAAVEKYNFNEPLPEKDRIRGSSDSLPYDE